MTKADLVEQVSEQVGSTKVATEKTLDAICTTAKEALIRGERVSLGDLGMLDTQKRKARKGRNLATGEETPIAPRIIAILKPSKGLKEALGAIEAL